LSILGKVAACFDVTLQDAREERNFAVFLKRYLILGPSRRYENRTVLSNESGLWKSGEF
jgi:hypothetical protein